jgi:peptidoglycan/LPS O-acetylase OafA/YrhL
MNSENKEKKKLRVYYAKLFGFRRAVPVILSALAVFVAVCFFTNGTGLLGSSVASVLLGLFSYGAYIIPALLLIHALFYAGDYVNGLTLSRSLFSFSTILIISGIEYISVFWKSPVFNPVEFYVTKSAGGFIGSIAAFGVT